jgi:hypothetical protein
MERKVQIKKAEQERGIKRSRSRSLDEEVKGGDASYEIIDQPSAGVKILTIKKGMVSILYKHD